MNGGIYQGKVNFWNRKQDTDLVLGHACHVEFASVGVVLPSLRPLVSDFDVFFTMILCVTSYCIWQDVKLIFTTQLQIASQAEPSYLTSKPDDLKEQTIKVRPPLVRHF